MEQLQKETVSRTRAAQAVTVPQAQPLSGNRLEKRLFAAADAKALQVGIGPDVVVAGDKADVGSRGGERSELSRDAARLAGNQKYFVVRKKEKAYMKEVFEVKVHSITTKGVQSLFLDGSDAKLIKGSRMLIVDDVCRSLLAYEIPLGVLTSLLGAPFFIFILYKRKGNG